MLCKKCGKATDELEICAVCSLEDEISQIDATKLNKKAYNKLLLKDGKVFRIIFWAGMALGIVTIMMDGYIHFIPALVFGVVGFKNLFVKKQTKNDIVSSKLIENLLEKHIQSGEILREEANLIRVRYDMCFRKNAVNIYQNRISSLKNARIKEINRIENARWTNVVKNKFRYNVTEGKAFINNVECLFSDINGATLVKTESHRVETTEKSVSKKKGSLGGAVAGGLVMGEAGALVGGVGLAKTNTTTFGSSNVIPTCVHLGVAVSINNFQHEIILSNEAMDQTSKKYLSLLEKAEEVLTHIQKISAMPVPNSYLLPEQEGSVLAIDAKIVTAEQELANIKTELNSIYI